MIIEVLQNHSNYLLIFLSIIVFLYLFGRSFLIILEKVNLGPNEEIFGTKTNIFYPIIGLFFLGNLLILLNFLIPIKNNSVLVICFLLLSLNLLDFNFRFKINYLNLIHLFVVPSILIFSLYGTNFHYDAGYYHLGNQLWIRETNLPFGFTNIFWAYGIGSIYEYIGAFFWLDSSLQSLHFINLIFINTFFSFLFYHAVISKDSKYKYSSYFLIIFALLDNFGYNGGRNGFLYVEGVGAFDNIVGILIFFTIIFGLYSLSIKSINKFELYIISLLSLFSIQLKLSSFILVVIFLRIVYLFMNQNNENIYRTSKLISINLIFFTSWMIKNYISTGCLVYPVNLTCINNFNWYRENSTLIYQNITMSYSNSYSLNSNFFDWFQDFISIEINQTVLFNYLLCLFILVIFKYSFFTIKNTNYEYKKFFQIFIILNFVYYLFFGPIPRYMIGILLFIIAYLGFNISSPKYKLNSENIFIIIFVLALLTFPRLNSYSLFLNNTHSLQIGVPTLETKNETWTTPVGGEDQCWTVQFCTPEKSHTPLIVDGFFKTIYFDN